MQNEDYKVRQIPDNFGNGVNVGGLHFKVIFLIEGIALAVIMLAASFIVLKAFGFSDIGQMLGICLVFSGIALVIGIRGINDEPVTTFARNYSAFRKGRRVAYYNPRIKREAKSVKAEALDLQNREAIPREKIMAAFSRYKESLDKKEQERIRAFEEAHYLDASSMYFEDDIGIVKRPNRYMSEETARKYDRKKEKIRKFKDNNLT